MSQPVEIIEDKYKVSYVPEIATITFEGSLLLNGTTAYEPILQLLTNAAKTKTVQPFKIDIRAIKFLNSSGINMLMKFIIHMSHIEKAEQNKLTLLLIAYQQVAWQKRLCINLRRLMPSLQTQLDEMP